MSSCKRKEVILCKARQWGITYFIENYCWIETSNGVQKIKLKESQKKWLRKLQQQKNDDGY